MGDSALGSQLATSPDPGFPPPCQAGKSQTQVEMALEPWERKPQISPHPSSHQPGEDIHPSEAQPSQQDGRRLQRGVEGVDPSQGRLETCCPSGVFTLGQGGRPSSPRPPGPHPDTRVEVSQTQLLLPRNHPPGLQGRTQSCGPGKVNSTPPTCCKSPTPSPSPQPGHPGDAVPKTQPAATPWECDQGRQ